jgi:thimet oligopeptidase
MVAPLHNKQPCRYSLDEEKIREYFPLGHVRSEVLAIYQELLGLEFARDKSSTILAFLGEKNRW